jgi:hypothetical protein
MGLWLASAADTAPVVVTRGRAVSRRSQPAMQGAPAESMVHHINRSQDDGVAEKVAKGWDSSTHSSERAGVALARRNRLQQNIHINQRDRDSSHGDEGVGAGRRQGAAAAAPRRRPPPSALPQPGGTSSPCAHTLMVHKSTSRLSLQGCARLKQPPGGRGWPLQRRPKRRAWKPWPLLPPPYNTGVPCNLWEGAASVAVGGQEEGPPEK